MAIPCRCLRRQSLSFQVPSSCGRPCTSKTTIRQPSSSSPLPYNYRASNRRRKASMFRTGHLWRASYGYIHRRGRLCLAYSLRRGEDDLGRINAFPRCSSWSTLLKESFGSSLDDILGLGSGTTVTSLLKAVAQASENAYFDADRTALSPIEVIWRPFNFAHEDSRGRGYLKFVASRLPELTKHVKYRFLPSSGPRELSGGLNLRDNLFSLQEACSCSLCRRLSASAQETFKLEIPLITSPDTSFCLRVLAETIISYSWLLSRVEAHADVLPSSSALQLLYLETFQVVAHGRHLLESRTI